jgi:hypothetical protein
MDRTSCVELIFAQKKMNSLSVSEQRKTMQAGNTVVWTTQPVPKIGQKSTALYFAVGFRAVLVAVQMFLAGRGLGHANGEQRHKADGRHKKASKHDAQAEMLTT